MSDFKYQFSLYGEHESAMRASAEADRGNDVSFFEVHEGNEIFHYYFSSLHLESLEDLNDVWDRATQLLSLYNAAYELIETAGSRPRLHYPSFKLQYLYLGSSSTKSFIPENLQHNNIAPFDADVPRMVRPGTLYGQLLDLARAHDDAYEVLLQLSTGHSMANYYKLLESVRTFMTPQTFDKMLTDNGFNADFDRFKTTSNNYSVGRVHSRHGVTPKKPNGKTMPKALSLDEAKGLALAICREFFTHAYKFRFPSKDNTALKSPSFIDRDFF